MPKTIREFVELKLNSLKGKFNLAQQYVNKLHENVDSLPMDGNSLLLLENMLLSMDEFVTNFDEVVPGLKQSAQTQIKFLEGSASNVPWKHQSDADILSRFDKLEVVVNDMRTAIHGGGDGETSRPMGILSHLSVLENSFNEGKQKLVSVEQRMQDMNVRHVSFVNEVRTKVMKEDRKKEMEDIAVTERFKNLEEKFQETMSDNNTCKERLICIEDELKSVKGVNIIHEDQKKELENSAVSERFKNLEEKVQETMSDNNACKQRLICVEDDLKSVNINEDQNKEQIQKLEGKIQEKTSDTNVYNQRLASVEDQLRSVKSVDDAKKSEEINNLKLQVTNLDTLTKTQIIERLSFLENHLNVAFNVFFKHDGPWTKGTVIQGVSSISFNVGNTFEEDKCRFLVPEDGIYGLILYLDVNGQHETGVELWTCDAVGGEWNSMISSVTAQGQVNGGTNCDVNLVHLEKGEAVRARVFTGNCFHECIISGWLVSPYI